MEGPKYGDLLLKKIVDMNDSYKMGAVTNLNV